MGSVSARASEYRCAELKPVVAQATTKMPSTATVLSRSQSSSARAVARDLTEPVACPLIARFRFTCYGSTAHEDSVSAIGYHPMLKLVQSNLRSFLVRTLAATHVC